MKARELEKYVDLYCIMQIIKNGGTAYIAKVYSGEVGSYDVYVTESPAHFYDSDASNLNGTLLYKGSGGKWIPSVAVHNKYTISSINASTYYN